MSVPAEILNFPTKKKRGRPKGSKASEETRQKMREAHRQRRGKANEPSFEERLDAHQKSISYKPPSMMRCSEIPKEDLPKEPTVIDREVPHEKIKTGRDLIKDLARKYNGEELFGVPLNTLQREDLMGLCVYMHNAIRKLVDRQREELVKIMGLYESGTAD